MGADYRIQMSLLALAIECSELVSISDETQKGLK
jgi:hypothetical protein